MSLASYATATADTGEPPPTPSQAPPTTEDGLDVLCRLPDPLHRLVTLLVGVSGWTYADTARLFDLRPDQIRTLRYEAQEQMKAILREVGA